MVKGGSGAVDAGVVDDDDDAEASARVDSLLSLIDMTKLTILFAKSENGKITPCQETVCSTWVSS